MIKNAVLHPAGEQPMVADLFVPPRPSDVTLLCTNVRTIDGKRPTGVERQDALFVIPLATIRFIEIPAEQLAAATAGLTDSGAAGSQRRTNGHSNGRSGALAGNAQAVPEEPAEAALVPIPGRELYSVLPDAGQPIELDAGISSAAHPEPDEDLLRRIRDI